MMMVMVMVMVSAARACVCCRRCVYVCVCVGGRHNQQWCPHPPHLCSTAAYLRGGAAPFEHPVDLVRPVRGWAAGGRAGGGSRRRSQAAKKAAEGSIHQRSVSKLLESATAMERWGAAGSASGSTVPRKQREAVCEGSARLTPNPSAQC